MLTSENDPDGRPLGPVARALADSIRSAGVGSRDLAAAELAQAYATDIDLGGDLVKLGPGLLRVLDALQLTPKSRAVAQKGGTVDPAAQPSQLDELRARRARKSDPPAVDPTAP